MTTNLNEIEKALGEATQGKWIDPWETEIDEDFEGIKSETGEVVLSVQWHDGDRLYLSKPNAHLIVNAPEWLRQLVQRVRKLEKVAEIGKKICSVNDDSIAVLKGEKKVSNREAFLDACAHEIGVLEFKLRKELAALDAKERDDEHTE